MKKTTIVGATIVGLTAVSMVVFWRRPVVSPELPKGAESDGDLIVEVARLRSEVQALRGAIAASNTTATVVPPPPPLEAKALSEADIKRMAEEQKERQSEIGLKLDQQLTSEAHDPGWSTQTAESITTALRDVAPGTDVSSVTCKRSLCRVAVSNQDPELQQRLPQLLAEQKVFHSGVIYQREESNPRATVLYVFRTPADLEGLTKDL